MIVAYVFLLFLSFAVARKTLGAIRKSDAELVAMATTIGTKNPAVARAVCRAAFAVFAPLFVLLAGMLVIASWQAFPT
jgi:hypothetical protein